MHKGYTKYNGPYEVIYEEKFATRSEAYRRELFLKSGSGREFLKEKLSTRE